MTNEEVQQSDFFPISAQEAKKIEFDLKTDSDNARLHFKLAHFYFLGKLSFVEKVLFTVRSPKSWLPKAIRAHEEHTLWLINQMPSHPWLGEHCVKIYPEFNPNGYEKAKSIWVNKIKEDPENVDLLSNAAQFFAHADPILARDLLLRALKIDKTNQEFQDRIAKLKIREKGA